MANLTDIIKDKIDTVNSIAGLQGLVGTTGQQVSVGMYHNITDLSGGGVFVWGTGKHKVGTFIDPDRPFPTDWNDQAQLEAWFADSGEFVEGWKRQYSGAVKSGWFINKEGDQTFQVQSLFDKFQNIVLTDNYSVDSVTISGVGKTIRFNGYSLTGTRPLASTTAQYVLGITGRELHLYDIVVNANFLNYVSCVRWHSLSAGAPAQFNRIFGITLSYCNIGILFGQEIGSTSIDAAQSENTVYSYTTRGIRTPVVSNQSNGYIEFVGSILDTNPYEWATQPSFDGSTYSLNSYVINNVLGEVTIQGGELLKTYTQEGYGVKGNARIFNAVIEIACNQYLVQDYIMLYNGSNGYMSGDSTSPITFENSTGKFLASNSPFLRGTGVASYSGAPFVKFEEPETDIEIKLIDCSLDEWKYSALPPSTIIRDCDFLTENIRVDTYKDACLLKESGTNNYINDLTGWNFVVSFGGGSTGTIANDSVYTGGTSLELHATGQSTFYAYDITDATTIKNTAITVKAEEYIKLSFYSKKVSGEANNNLFGVFYDSAGVQIGSPVSYAVVTATSWEYKNVVIEAPDNAMYLGIYLTGAESVTRITDLNVNSVSKKF
jgi:hypothetical protein